jgi:DNA-binding MarR family transcriptional regulator
MIGMGIRRPYPKSISISNNSMTKYHRVMAVREILDETMASWRRERPDLDLDAMGTALQMAQIMNLALRAVDDRFAAHGITSGEFDVLAALRRNGAGAALTPTALARVAMLSPAGMTNRLDRLEAAGLITRSPDPSDRRGSLVRLTRAGRTTADRALEDLVATETAFFESLSATDRRHLARILDRLLDALDEQPA